MNPAVRSNIAAVVLVCGWRVGAQRTGKTLLKSGLGQWFSIFLVLPPCNTVPYAVVTRNHKIILLLLPNYDFATVVNHNVKYLICDPCERVVQPTPKGSATQVESCWCMWLQLTNAQLLCRHWVRQSA